jgi:hypothetical protein
MKQCIVALLLAPAAVAFAPQARFTQSARNTFVMRSTLDDGGAASASEGAADLDGDVIPDEIEDQDRKASPLAELDLNAVGLGMDGTSQVGNASIISRRCNFTCTRCTSTSANETTASAVGGRRGSGACRVARVVQRTHGPAAWAARP